MGLLGLIFPLLSLVAFVAYIWLVVVAFKQSTLWGLLVLFLSPIAAIIFTIHYWEESKKPFLVYAGCVVGTILAMVVTFGSMGGFAAMKLASQMDEVTEDDIGNFIEGQMDRMENSGTLSREEQQELGKMRQMFQEIREEGSDTQDVQAPDPSPAIADTDTPAGLRAPSPVVASLGRAAGTGVSAPDLHIPDPADLDRPLAFRDAGRLIGSNVRVMSTDGRELKGRLTKAGKDRLTLEWWLNSGTISFEVRASEIDSLRVVQ